MSDRRTLDQQSFDEFIENFETEFSDALEATKIIATNPFKNLMRLMDQFDNGDIVDKTKKSLYSLIISLSQNPELLRRPEDLTRFIRKVIRVWIIADFWYIEPNRDGSHSIYEKDLMMKRYNKFLIVQRVDSMVGRLDIEALKVIFYKIILFLARDYIGYFLGYYRNNPDKLTDLGSAHQIIEEEALEFIRIADKLIKELSLGQPLLPEGEHNENVVYSVMNSIEERYWPLSILDDI
jgi:hypothetical protein